MTTTFLKKITVLGLFLMVLGWSGAFSPLLTQAAGREIAAENTVTMPIVSHPDLLPGPAEGDDQEAVQEYFQEQAIPTFISTFLGLVAGLAVLSLIISGLRFILAFGGEEGITAAKKNALWAAVGLGIAILAYAIVSIINTIPMPKGTYNPETQQQIEYDSI
ncbi:MAG: pilin [Candidatus Gracilibacteria bacterium]